MGVVLADSATGFENVIDRGIRHGAPGGVVEDFVELGLKGAQACHRVVPRSNTVGGNERGQGG